MQFLIKPCNLLQSLAISYMPNNSETRKILILVISNFWFNSFHVRGNFWHRSFGPVQDRHSVGPDLDPNCWTLTVPEIIF